MMHLIWGETMDIEFLISIAKANNSRDIISLYSLKNIRFSMGEIDQNPGLDGGSKNHIFTTFAHLFISHLYTQRHRKPSPPRAKQTTHQP